MSADQKLHRSRSAHPLEGAVLCGDCHQRVERCACADPDGTYESRDALDNALEMFEEGA